MQKFIYSSFFSILFWLLVYISQKGGSLHISRWFPWWWRHISTSIPTLM